MATTKGFEHSGPLQKLENRINAANRTGISASASAKPELSGSSSSEPRWRHITAATPGRVNTNEKADAPESIPGSASVIYIKERYSTMLKNDLILRNPLGVMGHENDEILTAGEFGAVLARAGVGKTAFLVQLSLNALLRGKNVLHISLTDPVHKVSLWYKEVFGLIAEQYQVDSINQLWESVLPHRFIMTFRVEGFSVPKLRERLADLTEQHIFSPQMMIVDGFPFDESMHQSLGQFKNLIEQEGIPAWFTVRTHRHEEPEADGTPQQLADIADLFKIAIQLVPEGKEIHVRALKGGEVFSRYLDLRLDPATMLLTNPR
jgi:hypothetical protein